MQGYTKELDSSILSYMEQNGARIDKVFQNVLSQMPVTGFIRDIAEKNIVSKGKRLRSNMLFCITNLYGGNVEEASYYAAVVESTHQASLIHDDIVDTDIWRRGDLSVFGKYGAGLAVLAGDTVISLATKIIVYVPMMHIPEALMITTHTWNKLTSGAVEELLIKEPTISSWSGMAYSKTGVLFECAYKLGGLAASCPYDVVRRLGESGYKYGLAFQMADDMADVFKVLKEGKLSKDIQKGYLTFPLAYIYEHGDEKTRALINAWLQMRLQRLINSVPIPGVKELLNMFMGDKMQDSIKVTEEDILNVLRQLEVDEIKNGCLEMIDSYVKSSMNIIKEDSQRFVDAKYLEYLEKLQQYGIVKVMSE